jgi:hypothetical protein
MGQISAHLKCLSWCRPWLPAILPPDLLAAMHLWSVSLVTRARPLRFLRTRFNHDLFVATHSSCSLEGLAWFSGYRAYNDTKFLDNAAAAWNIAFVDMLPEGDSTMCQGSTIAGAFFSDGVRWKSSYLRLV